MSGTAVLDTWIWIIDCIERSNCLIVLKFHQQHFSGLEWQTNFQRSYITKYKLDITTSKQAQQRGITQEHVELSVTKTILPDCDLYIDKRLFTIEDILQAQSHTYSGSSSSFIWLANIVTKHLNCVYTQRQGRHIRHKLQRPGTVIW